MNPSFFAPLLLWSAFQPLLISAPWKWTPALTLSLPPLSSSLIFSLASTVLLRSLCRRRPKSRNIVEPPERTMFCSQGNGTVRAVTWCQTMAEVHQRWLWKCSSPYREDAWRQWGSSGWLHPPLQRWAGWSPGWQTGMCYRRWCVTLCCIHTADWVEHNDWPQGGRRSQAPGSARSPRQWWTPSCWWRWCRCTAWSTWNRPCRICWTLSPDLGTRSWSAPTRRRMNKTKNISKRSELAWGHKNIPKRSEIRLKQEFICRLSWC